MLSKCKRMTVHAVGIRGNQTDYAYNGNETKCKNIVGACGCIHAEVNLLKKMPNPEIVIVSHSPCILCAIVLAQSGVKKVEYYIEYRLTDGIDYLRKYGIEVNKIDEIDLP